MLTGNYMKKLTLFVLFGWVCLLLYMKNSWTESSIDVSSLENKIMSLDEEVSAVGLETKKLTELIVELKNLREMGLPLVKNKKDNVDDGYIYKVKSMLSSEKDTFVGRTREYLRRRAATGLTEFDSYLYSQINDLLKIADKGPLATGLAKLLASVNEQGLALRADVDYMGDVDGASDWRKRELSHLAHVIKTRIDGLQHPKDCNSARQLVCNLNKGCGFGCQAHHVVFCFILAYSTGRTFILESKSWRYSQHGWQAVFLPLSSNCTVRAPNQRSIVWGANGWEQSQIVEVPIVDSLRYRPDYLPQATPADLFDRLVVVHGSPFVWFVGQLLHYLLRPQPDLANQMANAVKAMGDDLSTWGGPDSSPIVGVHVRRTDKVGIEAAFHPVEEYMNHVERYFSLAEMTESRKHDGKPVKLKRRVYLATDDPQVLSQAKTKYPNYQFLSDNSISKSAGLSSRYTENALKGVIIDIFLLAKTDYLVCTFSSQVCRLAYELMQTRHEDLGDASWRFHSLDDIYYFGGQNAAQVRVLLTHEGVPGEISLSPKQVFKLAGNHWNGYSKASLDAAGATKGSLFPSYKVEQVLVKAKMGHYADSEDVSSPHTLSTLTSS